MITATQIIKALEYDLFNIALRNDGIACIYIKTNEEFEVDHVKEVVKALGKMMGVQKYPLLIVSSDYCVPTAAARAYIATQECNPSTIAEAYVIKSFSQKLMGNVYLSFNKPARPTRIFTAEEPAVTWLKTYLQ